MRRARELFDCPRVLKGYFNVYVLSSLEFFAQVRQNTPSTNLMLSGESYLGLLCSIVRSAEKGGLCCLVHRRKVGALCLLYKIYQRVDDPLNEYMNSFIVTRNTRVTSILGELSLVIPRCGTDQFNRLYLLPAVHLCNLLSSRVFSGDFLSSFKSAMNVCP